MALKFEPEEVVYDPGGLLSFFVTENLMPIQRAITLWALMALEEAALAGPNAMVTTYRRNRELIQKIAERKHLAGQFDTGGSVVVRLKDVTALLP